jgi:hypothetical protein
MKDLQVKELLYQALETEIGGQSIYETAVRCAKNEELKTEWQEYLEQTRHHHEVLLKSFEAISLDPAMDTPGRKIVRHHGEGLVRAMEMAMSIAPESAEIVAAECVVLAETKDHHNWQLLHKVGEEAKGTIGKAIREAVEEVEDEEDEHLYHTMGWSRELWIESLGLPAVIPPPEEEKDVKTMIGAARAAQSRETML